MEIRELKSCAIHDTIKCDKCVIVLSTLLNDLCEESVIAQQSIYRCNSHSLRNTVYTNLYNIATDLIFRMCYKCGELFKMLATTYGVTNLLILDDVQGFCDIDKCINEERNSQIYDIETGIIYRKDRFIRLLIYDLYKYTEWCPPYEHDDLLQIEKYLAEHYPAYYNFSMEDRFKYYKSNPTPSNPETKEKKRKCILNLMRRITSLQTTIHSLIKHACIAFVSTILKNNKTVKGLKHLNLNFVPVAGLIDERLVFSIFTNEKTIYITPHAFKNKNFFIYRNGVMYYPFICRSAEEFISFDIDAKDIMRRLVGKIGKTNKRNIVNSWLKLFNVCKIECGFGVFDVNSDYRYTVFENIKRLIVDQQIETTLPAFIEETELMWITDTEYMEQVPEWVGMFNSISRIKI